MPMMKRHEIYVKVHGVTYQNHHRQSRTLNTELTKPNMTTLAAEVSYVDFHMESRNSQAYLEVSLVYEIKRSKNYI
jgi:hypothetical protein